MSIGTSHSCHCPCHISQHCGVGGSCCENAGKEWVKSEPIKKEKNLTMEEIVNQNVKGKRHFKGGVLPTIDLK